MTLKLLAKAEMTLINETISADPNIMKRGRAEYSSQSIANKGTFIKDVQFLGRQVCQGKSDIVHRQRVYSAQDIGRQVSPKIGKTSDILYERSLRGKLKVKSSHQILKRGQLNFSFSSDSDANIDEKDLVQSDPQIDEVSDEETLMIQ